MRFLYFYFFIFIVGVLKKDFFIVICLHLDFFVIFWLNFQKKRLGIAKVGLLSF